MEFLEFKNFVEKDILIPEFNKIMAAAWECSGSSNSEIDDKILLYKNLIHDPLYHQYLFGKLENITNKKYIIDRIYANGQFHSQSGSMHTDYEPTETSARTLLIYLNKEWKPEWGGHTIIQDSCGDYHSILPEPGKAILFNGYMNHVGLEPTIHCKTMRVTVAFKMREVCDL